MPRKPLPIRELFFNTGERSAGSAVPIWACRRCGWKLVDNATRFARHALRCPSTQPGDRELAHAHLGSLAGTSAAQLEAISVTADEFGRAFTLEGKAHIRSLFEDTHASRSGEKAKLFRCKRCGHETTENATRFAQHILKCGSATDDDRTIAHEHQALTAKRREMRQARQSNGGDLDLQTSTSNVPAAQNQSSEKPSRANSQESAASGNHRPSVSNQSEDNTASNSTIIKDEAPDGSRSASVTGVNPADTPGFQADGIGKQCSHDVDPVGLGLDARAAVLDDKAELGLQLHSAMPGEVRHGITNLDALDCFVDEGFEEELARLSPTSTEALSIERIPSGAEGDVTLATLATALSPLRQGSRALMGPSCIGRGNSGYFSDTFAHEEKGNFEDIQDLLPTLDLVTTSYAIEPEPENNVIAPIVFQKRQRDNNGERVPAETVSISLDEYQQWKQWKAQMSMPKIIQVPDMEYSMFQNLYSFFIGHAMNCSNAYFSHGGFNGPSCNSEMIGQAISGEWAQLAAVYKTMVTCCAKAQARYVLEKASTCPERIASVYNSTLALAQDCLDIGIAGALQKWSLIPRLDDNQNAAYRGLDKAFKHMTIDDNGARHAPDPKTEGAILKLQHFTCKYGPYLRNLYLNNSNFLTGGSSSFAEQVQQPHFGSGPSFLMSGGSTPSNALGISESDFTSWHKQASEFTPLMDGISSDTRSAVAVTALLTELYSVAGWDLVLVI